MASPPNSPAVGQKLCLTGRFRFSLRSVLWFVFVCAVASAVVSRVVLPVLEAARQRECANKLKQIGIALQTYREVYGSFPPPYIRDTQGTPMTSWRVAIVPYLDQASLPPNWYNFAIPWNAPRNLAATSRMTSDRNPYRCPSASGQQPPTSANYVMIVGGAPKPGAAESATFGGAERPAETVIVAEVATTDIFWAEPRDLTLEELSPRINDKLKPSISSHHPHGAMVLFADGTTQFLDESTTPEELWMVVGNPPQGAAKRGQLNGSD